MCLYADYNLVPSVNIFNFETYLQFYRKFNRSSRLLTDTSNLKSGTNSVTIQLTGAGMA